MPAPSKLAISTSVVQRLVKEEASYRKEEKQQEARIEKLQGNNTGENAEYELKQERLALEETKKIFPELQKKITEAVERLEAQLALSRDDGTSAEVITKAEEVVKEAHSVA